MCLAQQQQQHLLLTPTPPPPPPPPPPLSSHPQLRDGSALRQHRAHPPPPPLKHKPFFRIHLTFSTGTSHISPHHRRLRLHQEQRSSRERNPEGPGRDVQRCSASYQVRLHIICQQHFCGSYCITQRPFPPQLFADDEQEHVTGCRFRLWKQF